jgi:dipeptidyl aminopeptidase/acylaminoacyl peptidase/CubicO group peptidase (beta-lactamase class C family)
MTSVRRMRLDDLARVAIPAEPAISPDGTTIVYTLQTVDSEADARRSSLWRVPSADGEPVRLTQGQSDSAPAWSPDGSRLAFLRKLDGDPAQIWLLPAGFGEPVRLTSLPGGAGAPVWSPDGARIAFTAPVDTDRPDHAPIVVDRLDYKADGTGLWRDKRRQLFIVDVETGEARQLTRSDRHAGPPAWSPDGRRLAFPAATAPDADVTGEWVVHVIDAAGGSPRPVGGEHGIAGPVTWTPDGDALVVVGMPEVRAGHNLLLRVPVDGSPTTDLTADLDRNVLPGSPGYPGGLPQFAPDGTLLFCARDRGCTHLFAIDAGGDAPRLMLGGGDRVVSGLSVAAAAPRAAVVIATPHSYGDLAVVDLATGTETTLTDYALADVDPFVPEERVFTISDGTEVHGWLLRDPAAPTPAPLLLDIHGGPHNVWNPALSSRRPYHQPLAASGWTVLLLNPRGSDGYGEAFYTAAVGGWGLADERDFLEPVDALIAEGIADPERLAVTGYSYGGYMTCWLTGRTDRFGAAVAGGPVADLTSIAGTSDVGHLLVGEELGTLPYRDPAKLNEMSPYTRVGEVRTPTLILQGLADDRTPAGQAEQWFAALRGRGVPSRLVLYPESSHMFLLGGRPSHGTDYAQRLTDWVNRHTRRVPPIDREHWQRRLDELAERFHVPGAVLGIARGDETVSLAYGVANVDTGVEVTTDTLFRIASITKVFTATAVMRLVDDGRLDLDKPVVSYLPELKLADPEVTAQVTMRHLLSHTSGIDGDFFHDTGRGDEALARYVAALADLPQNHPVGATFSYCNAGYSVAGRVIEVLTGKVWDEAMRGLVLAPLGLERTVTMAEEAVLHRVAIGHVHAPDEPPRRADVWAIPRSIGPAGILCSTVADVLAFARLHLAGGVAADGTRLLSARSAAAMRTEQVALPSGYVLADSWGLGLARGDWGGTQVIGHDGGVIGQQSYLRLLPEHDLAVVLLTNAGTTRDLYETLMREVVDELAGVEMPRPLTPPADPPQVDIGQYEGTYERTGVRFDIERGEQGLLLRITDKIGVPGFDRPPEEFHLVPMGEDRFAFRLPGTQTWQIVSFYRLPDGSSYLHLGFRATPRAGR